MKRISLIILAVAAIIAGSVSCQKVNDLDKRLTQLEQTVSDLKAQVLAGAVITFVDKTADGCTFTLSNGQSYTVTNGKNGSDGEAIIADVKIEENFIVLTLKNGETLRISYQNPLSMVTLNIVPDYDDGTVGKPKTTEAMGMKSNHFYLDVAVTPAKYAKILEDTEKYIHKAVFSPVQTKSGFGNAFTVSPTSVTYMDGAPVPFLQASFDLDDETAAALQNSSYTVSYSIKDKDGVHGAATAFVAISNKKSSGGDIPTDDIQITLIQPDKSLPGVFTVADPDGIPDSGDETKVQFSQGNLASRLNGTWGVFPNQYDCMNTVSCGDVVSLYAYGAIDYFGPLGDGPETTIHFDELSDFGRNLFPDQGWRMLSAQEWCYLFGIKDHELDDEYCYELYEPDECNPRRNLFRIGVEVMENICVVLYPDNYQGSKDETFNTESDYEKATEAGIVFLPLAGYSTGRNDINDFGEVGYYWSNTNGNREQVYAINIYPPTLWYTNVARKMCHNHYLSVRLVKDYNSVN